VGEIKSLPATAEGPKLRPPERIADSHDLTAFDCGSPELDAWLKNRALDGRSARAYVVAVDNRVVAYYCLSAGSVIRADLPKKAQRNTPDQIPVVIIGRLAVDRRFQSRGFGKGLLKDAILRALQASEAIGVRAIVVHALDDEAAKFYRKFGFVDSPLNPRTLVLPIETAKQALA